MHEQGHSEYVGMIKVDWYSKQSQQQGYFHHYVRHPAIILVISQRSSL